MFLVSYDVTSFFTTIPLTETIDLAVNAIFECNAGSDLKLNNLKELRHGWRVLTKGKRTF